MQIFKKTKAPTWIQDKWRKTEARRGETSARKKEENSLYTTNWGENVFPAARIICILPKTKLN